MSVKEKYSVKQGRGPEKGARRDESIKILIVVYGGLDLRVL